MIAELLISAALIVSGIFGFTGSYGLLKLTDTPRRLHAPTKATTLGVGGVLIASMVYALVSRGHLSVHELLISLFLFVTAPITANFIAKAYIARNVRNDDLPPCPGDHGWSVFDDPPESRPGP